jgi:hypothetical protein
MRGSNVDLLSEIERRSGDEIHHDISLLEPGRVPELQ